SRDRRATLESMTDPLRAAVVGLGSMGANHVRVLADLPGVELVGVVDADPARGPKLPPARPLRGFTDLGAMLAETRPDMVSVVVPTGLHEQVSMQVIEGGVHLLVEQPIAATLPAA